MFLILWFSLKVRFVFEKMGNRRLYYFVIPKELGIIPELKVLSYVHTEFYEGW